MANISGSVSLAASLTQSKVTSSGDVSTNLTVKVAESQSYKNGTAAGQLDLLYNGAYTISSPTTIDLTALADNLVPGGTSNFARVREFIAINQSPTTDLNVYAAAANGWAVLPPGVGAPTGFGAAAVGSGGTFAAGTYFWVITATTAQGETLQSSQATATLVLNGSATLTWSAVTGATGYKVYRTTTTGTYGASSFVKSVAGGSTVTTTDTGTATTTGTPPTTSTAGSASPISTRSNSGVAYISDRNSTGPGVGNVVTSTSRLVTFDPGTTTIAFNLVIAGCSAA